MDKNINSKRLHSLDALRGFDMLMISGGGLFLLLMHGKTNMEWLNSLANQMDHPAWDETITFFDFIFPLFLFISGVSISFSVSSQINKGVSKFKIYKKSFKRMLLLMLLGIIYKNSPLDLSDFSQIRYSSILGRIGMATFFTTLLYVNYSWQKRLICGFSILLFYYAAMFLIPVPGFGVGDFSMEGNLIGWIDRTIMPGRLAFGIFDELAIAAALPTFTVTIFGAWVGDIMRNDKSSPYYKIKLLTILGVSSVAIGLVWGMHLPIMKRLWTGSFVMISTGASILILVLFYWLIDVRKYTRWAFFFKVIGLNSLLIYLLYRFIDFNKTSQLLFSGFYHAISEKWHEVFETFGALVLVWLLLYFLYEKRLFLKI